MIKNLKFLDLIYPKQKKIFFLILVMVIFASLLETLGVASIIPLLSFMVSGKNFLEKFSFFQNDIGIENFLSSYSNKEIIIFLLIVIILTFVIKNLYLVFFNYIKETFLFNLRKSFSQKLFNKFLNLNYEKFNKFNSSNYINTILNVVSDSINNIISSSIYVLTEILLVIFIFTLLFAIEPLSSIFAITTFSVVTFFIYFKIKLKLKILGKKKLKHDQRQIQNLSEGFAMIKYLKTINNFSFFESNFNYNNSMVNDVSKTQLLLEIFPKYILEIISVLMMSLLILFLLFFLNFDFQQIVPIVGFYALAAIRLTPSVNKILSSMQKLKYGLVPMDKLYRELINYKKNVKKIKYYDLKKSIKFKNIFFSYNNRNILKNTNLEINLGEKIGIIGKTGSGKTTLIDIISGILKPKNGIIYYDDVNIKTIKNQVLKIGYVPQSANLIAGSLKDNITLNLKKFNNKLYKKIIYCSCLDVFYKKNKNRILNSLGESGSKISGGQKQRISIARALYSNPQILIFDEGTNALDKKTENKLIERIFKNYPKIIILFISHSINYKNCDKIFKVSNQKLLRIK